MSLGGLGMNQSEDCSFVYLSVNQCISLYSLSAIVVICVVLLRLCLSAIGDLSSAIGLH